VSATADRRHPRARLALDPRLRERTIGAYLDARLHLAALSLVAGAIHAVVAAPHFEEFWLFGSFFAGLALFQVGWGVRAYRRPSALVYRIGIWASLAVVAVWIASRTVGLPLGPEAGTAEAVGPLDSLASAIELAIAGLGAALLAPGRRLPAPVGVVRAVVLGLMSVGLLALVLGAGHH
jgi:hypothetical protein